MLRFMQWSPQDLVTVISSLRRRRGDATRTEVKKSLFECPESIGETLCAFANMPDGGTIILGVDEKAGFAITGVQDVARVEQGVASTARNYVDPSPHVDFQTLIHESKSVLIVTVNGLSVVDKPARYKTRAYLRQSDGDYVMNDAELRMIEVAKLHAQEQVDYDARPVAGTSRRDLNENLVTQYLRSRRASSRRLVELDDEDLLRTTGVITAEGEATVAGLYALGVYPQGHLPALGATAAVRDDVGSGARARNRRDFDGPLPEMLEDMREWVAMNISKADVYDAGGHLRESPSLPMTAVRELIGNALVHRDLGPNTVGQGKSIQIRITSKGLFIESPGGLKGLSVTQLISEEHAQAAVNQRLYNIAKYLRTADGANLIEGEGGGIREVLEATRRNGLPAPHLVNSGVKFKAVLWNAADAPVQSSSAVTSGPDSTRTEKKRLSGTDSNGQDRRLGKNGPAVMQALRDGKEMSVRDLSARLGLSIPQTRYALHALMKHGLVNMKGRQGQRGTVYTAD